jgi:DNA repair photolyase
VSPVIPGLTDHELPAILEAASGAGARSARAMPLRLPGAVAGLFETWLEEHAPLQRAKVLSRVRAMRGGHLNDPRFGTRMTGEGVLADHLRALFETVCRRLGLATRGPELDGSQLRRPGEQRRLEF